MASASRLVIAGSLRAGSFNDLLAQAATVVPAMTAIASAYKTFDETGALILENERKGLTKCV